MLPLQDTIRSRSLPIVNWMLIGLNVLGFLLLLSLGPQQAEVVVTVLGVVPQRLLAHFNLAGALTIFTS